jgi:hypothetical protein
MGIISAVKRVEFISDRLTLKGCWCDITFLNVHASTEDISDDMKDSCYGEQECEFNQFLKY